MKDFDEVLLPRYLRNKMTFIVSCVALLEDVEPMTIEHDALFAVVDSDKRFPTIDIYPKHHLTRYAYFFSFFFFFFFFFFFYFAAFLVLFLFLLLILPIL